MVTRRGRKPWRRPDCKDDSSSAVWCVVVLRSPSASLPKLGNSSILTTLTSEPSNCIPLEFKQTQDSVPAVNFRSLGRFTIALLKLFPIHKKLGSTVKKKAKKDNTEAFIAGTLSSPSFLLLLDNNLSNDFNLESFNENVDDLCTVTARSTSFTHSRS